MKTLVACLVIFSYVLTNCQIANAQTVKTPLPNKIITDKKEKGQTHLFANYRKHTKVHLNSILTESADSSVFDNLIIDLLMVVRMIISIAVILILVVVASSSIFFHKKIELI